MKLRTVYILALLALLIGFIVALGTSDVAAKCDKRTLIVELCQSIATNTTTVDRNLMKSCEEILSK